MPFRYEYKCDDGHLTERRRAYSERRNPIACHCGFPAKLIISVPAEAAATRNYEGGKKIAPWTLPPMRDPRTGAVLTNSDGSVKMQHVEAGSRADYLRILKKNGLRELETESDNFVQGGDAKKRSEADKELKLKARTADMASTYARLKKSPEATQKIIKEAISKGERAASLSAPQGN